MQLPIDLGVDLGVDLVLVRPIDARASPRPEHQPETGPGPWAAVQHAADRGEGGEGGEGKMADADAKLLANVQDQMTR